MLHGAYHWKEYQAPTVYRDHANFVKDWVTGPNVLDVGAGDGLISHLLRNKGLSVLAIDDDPDAVLCASQMGEIVKWKSVYDLDPDNGTFDSVFMGDVLEHLEHPILALTKVKAVLKPGGLLFITTPPKKEQGLWDPLHYVEYSETELGILLSNQGFTLFEPIHTANIRMYAKFKLL